MTRTMLMGAAATMVSTFVAVQDGLAQDRADQLLGFPSPPAATASAPPSPDPDAEETRITRALNDEIAAQNALAENQERADQAAYEESVIQATRARLAHEEAVRQAEAARRRWEVERARWEADVRACDAGDRARCAPASVSPRP